MRAKGGLSVSVHEAGTDILALQQQFNGLSVASECSLTKWGSSNFADRVNVVTHQQRFDDSRGTVVGGVPEWGLTVIVSCIEINVTPYDE